MDRQTCDIAVIGAGPGGYIAAIKAAQNGRKVALIEKEQLGGVCLNVGCIPTKTLLASGSVLQKVYEAKEHGIFTGDISFDFAKMKERKDGVIEKIRKSLEGLLQSNRITILRGQASFLSPKEIKIKGQDNLLLQAERTIIATGSIPLDIPAFPCDHKRVLNSSSILELTALPKRLIIIGGGYIGSEFASLYAELGVQVTLVEALPSILYSQGKALAEFLTRAFQKKGIEILTNTLVEKVEHRPDELIVHLQGKAPIACDKLLVAVGRKIPTEHLGLELAGVKTDPKGAILVDEKMQTNVPGIYAIGDVTGKALLAHVASHQGVIAASNALGIPATMHYEAVPAVIFTHPEMASVGLTLEQALEKGYDAGIGKFPFQALGKSIASLETEGFAQIVIDKKTGEILGAQVAGKEASTLIAEIALAMTNELTIDSIQETIHAHPTLSEAWLEAALISTDSPLHFPPKIRK